MCVRVLRVCVYIIRFIYKIGANKSMRQKAQSYHNIQRRKEWKISSGLRVICRNFSFSFFPLCKFHCCLCVVVVVRDKLLVADYSFYLFFFLTYLISRRRERRRWSFSYNWNTTICREDWTEFGVDLKWFSADSFWREKKGYLYKCLHRQRLQQRSWN